MDIPVISNSLVTFAPKVVKMRLKKTKVKSANHISLLTLTVAGLE